MQQQVPLLGAVVVDQVAHFLFDTLGTELMLIAIFCAGFLLFRLPTVQQVLFGGQRWKAGKGAPLAAAAAADSAADRRVTLASSSSAAVAAKQLEANWAAGNFAAVLEAWPHLECFTVGALTAVIEALAAAGREDQIIETVRRIVTKHNELQVPEALLAALDALPESLRSSPSSGALRLLRQAFAPRVPPRSSPTTAAADALGPGAAATAAAAVPAAAIPATPSQNVSMHSRAVVERARALRSALRANELEEALRRLGKMCDAGDRVPGACIVSLARLARSSKGGPNFLSLLPSKALSYEVVAALVDDVVKATNPELLRELHQRLDMDAGGSGGVASRAPLCEALLRGYAMIGDSRAVEVFDRFVQDGFEPTAGTLSNICSSCAESRHVQLAEHLVLYARREGVGHTTLALYSAMMKVYQHAKLFHKTCDLHEGMVQDGIEPDTVAYGCLIKAAVESGRVELARRLFLESGNPDLLNYMSLIRAAGRERDVPKALELLGELERSPLPVDITAYNCVLEVCAVCGGKSEGDALFKRMEAAGHVDVVSYNTRIKACVTNGQRAALPGILEAMRSRGIQLNVVTYNSLIKDCIMRQESQRAWQYVNEMEAAGVAPDAFTCSILVKGVKHAFCAEEVDAIIGLVERVGVTPDEVLVTCLLDACVRLKGIPRLNRILDQFTGSGVVPSLHSCATLLKAYGHARRLDCAWLLWRELVGERRLTPTEEMFANMIDACVVNGAIDDAIAVFHEMKATVQISRSASALATLIKACVMQKDVTRALEIYNDLKEGSVSIGKVTYNTLIDALVRLGNMDRATQLFRDMDLSAVSPDLITYSTLIKGHAACGDLEQGLQLLGIMQKRGIMPDAIVFNSILDGCAHKQMRTLTEQVLQDMEGVGIKPSNFTLSILVKLYGRCNDLDKAFEVVSEYPKKYSFAVNAQVYTCLMFTCISGGELPRALDVYERMRTAGCPGDAKMYQTLLLGCVRYLDFDAAVRILGDALEPSTRSAPCLDAETADYVLLALARQGRGLDIGLPMLERLREAGVRVSERASSALLRRQQPPHSGGSPKSRMHPAVS